MVNLLLIEDAEMDVRIPQLPIEFLRIRSLIIPMRFGNDVIGIMILLPRTGNTRFTLSDLNLAQALAGQASRTNSLCRSSRSLRTKKAA